jgi:HlyD family secretion protein
MNKTVKWVLIGLGAVIVLLIVGKMAFGSKEKGVKVAVEKAAQRTITETVNASGKVYPEVEVKVSRGGRRQREKGTGFGPYLCRHLFFAT